MHYLIHVLGESQGWNYISILQIRKSRLVRFNWLSQSHILVVSGGAETEAQVLWLLEKYRDLLC